VKEPWYMGITIQSRVTTRNDSRQIIRQSLYAALGNLPKLAFELNFHICTCWKRRTAFHKGWHLSEIRWLGSSLRIRESSQKMQCSWIEIAR
jgi:hypothetical protein